MNQAQPDSNTSVPAAETPKARARFGRTFWVLNSIEMWERLAYYNLRVMAPIYIMQADNPGGLHLSAIDKGVIYLWWSVFQSVLPTVTGGLADRFGYKRTLAFAISTIMAGYLMIAFMRDLSFISNYWSFFIAIMTMATGTAFFKPSIQGSIAHNLTKENSSVGWGVFYWVVNVGAFIGHYLPSGLLLAGPALVNYLTNAKTGSVQNPETISLLQRLLGSANSAEAWRNLFIMSAVFTSFNLLLLLAFKDTPSGASKSESLFTVLRRTVTNIFEPRLLSWILIMSGFWLMMYQLWDLHPNFITDWVDSSRLVEKLRWLPRWMFLMITEEQARGVMIPQQVILSANSLMIICAVVAVSWLARHMRTLSAMTIGMVMGIAGLIISGWTQNIYFLLLGVVCFSFGEMLTGPKKSEYLAIIAPPGKKGLYLGYVNIPAGIGSGIGGLMAGYLYKHYGEKAVLALKYLATETPWGQARGWNGDLNTLEATLEVTRSEAMLKLQEVSGLDAIGATNLLWNEYHPHYVWLPFAAVGVVSAIALYIFGRMARKWHDMNA